MWRYCRFFFFLFLQIAKKYQTHEKKLRKWFFSLPLFFPYTRYCTFSNRNAKMCDGGKKKIYFIALKNSHFYNPNRAIKKTSKQIQLFCRRILWLSYYFKYINFFFRRSHFFLFHCQLFISEPFVEKNL